MAAFDDFWKNLVEEFEQLVRKTFKDFSKEAQKDGRAFLQKTKEDLKRWTKLLAAGHLTADDFQWLVLGKKDLAQMAALQQAGVTRIRIERLQYAMIDLVIDTALDTFL